MHQGGRCKPGCKLCSGAAGKPAANAPMQEPHSLGEQQLQDRGVQEADLPTENGMID